MPIVLLMSTDADIVNTPLAVGWPPPTTDRYTWAQVNPMNLGLAGGAEIVVIAHGNGTEIGNADPGTIDINATVFLALIQGNMQAGTYPAAIYISTCGPGIAQFAANVRLQAEQNEIWANTRIFGHNDAVSGSVPPPGDISWTQIF
jgi:hypothetical protein